MKDFFAIFRRNFVSPIVISILVLASILLILGEYQDAWFISVVIVLNTSLAVIQEYRAQRELKKLELMSAPRARRILKDGTFQDVMFDELIVGDTIKIQHGDEIPADGEIMTSSGLEVDESILTGEAASIEKSNKSTVYAASIITAGEGIMLVESVGVNTKAGSMTSTLKKYSPQQTPLQHNIGRAISLLTYGALGLALLIFVVYYLSGQDAIQIFKTITSAAVTVVPEGLLLASTLLLAYGSLRLAQAKVLPQKLSAIEGMALLDVLCVDKTGTLTSDDIAFEKFELFNKKFAYFSDLVGIVAVETSRGSATGDAIISNFPTNKTYEVIQTLAFSSSRKMSGLKLKYKNKVHTVIMGAPEFVDVLAPMSLLQKQQVNDFASDGKRVLLVADFTDTETSIKSLENGSGRAVGLMILSNELREGVKKTVNYLQKNKVSLRVISGDNPKTVQYVAEQAGILKYQKILTGDELKQIEDKDWDATIFDTTIFARVLPEQKERIIDTFMRLGNYTGMVGDGVNDALAIKRSDLGIAMYAGASATRRVADIVLLNNSFNSLPMGMRLGNRIMQAIELVATLFFHKIIYGVILLLSTLASGMIYPFMPRNISFLNIFLVTLPTIMWTVFTPSPRHRLSPRYFWKDTLLAVAPIAILSGIMVTATYAVLNSVYANNHHGVSTTTVIIATFFGIYLVLLVPRMFDIKNTKKTQLARALYVLTVFLVIVPVFRFSFIRDFYDFTTPVWQKAWFLVVAIVGVAFLQWLIAGRIGRNLKKRDA